MENATKALLIAAAVLIAILLITFGVGILNTSTEQAGNIDLSEYEIQKFNDKFTKYEGDNVSGSEANALLTTVFNHNLAQETADTKVTVQKGTINAEVMVLNERIVNIEHNMDNNCKDVEIQLKGIEEQTKTQFNDLNDAKKEDEKLSEKIDKLDEKLDKKISKITGYYMTFTLGILVSLAIGVISLLR